MAAKRDELQVEVERIVGPMHGRRQKKVDSRLLLKAISSEFDVDEIRQMLRSAYITALNTEDWKGQLEVLKFIYSYAVGKPVERSISATVDREEFLALFGRGKEEEEEDGAGSEVAAEGSYRQSD